MTTPAESEWKRKYDGRLDRSYVKPSGIEVTESFSARYGSVSFYESAPGISRRRTEWVEQADSDSTSLPKDDTAEIMTLSDDSSFTLRAELYPSEKLLHIGLKQNRIPGEFDWEVMGDRRLSAFRYSPSDATRVLIYLGSVSLDTSEHEEDIPQQDYRAALSILLNYIRTNSEGYSEQLKNFHESVLDEYIEEKFLVPDHPRVVEAYQVVDKLVRKLLVELPWEEAQEASDLLSSIGFECDLMKNLLDEYIRTRGVDSVKDFIEKRTEDVFLNLFVYLAAHTFTPFPQPPELIEIEPSPDAQFKWRKTERRIIEEDQPDGLWNEADYGSEIEIYENRFRIFKANETIVIMFYGRDIKWSVTFPLSVEFDEIKSLMTEKDADFREIRPLLSKIIFRRSSS